MEHEQTNNENNKNENNENIIKTEHDKNTQLVRKIKYLRLLIL